MARKSFFCSGFQESISRSGLTLDYRSVCPSNPDLQASIKEPSPLVGAGSSASSRAEALYFEMKMTLLSTEGDWS